MTDRAEIERRLNRLEGRTSALALVIADLCRRMPAELLKSMIASLEELRDAPPGSMSDISEESSARQDALAMLIQRLQQSSG